MIPATTWRKQGDIDILMMGEVPVGRINPPAKAWILNLNSPACFWKGEKTESQARVALVCAFNAWLLKAGIAGPDQGELFSTKAAVDPLPEAIAALAEAKRELWSMCRNQWNLSDFKNFAVIQQIDAALDKARASTS